MLKKKKHHHLFGVRPAHLMAGGCDHYAMNIYILLIVIKP